jgi:hypothetical protein
MAVTLGSGVRDMFNTDLAKPQYSGCSTPVKLDSFENCAPLGYYTTRSGNFLSTFRDKLLVSSSGVKNPKALL